MFDFELETRSSSNSSNEVNLHYIRATLKPLLEIVELLLELLERELHINRKFAFKKQ